MADNDIDNDKEIVFSGEEQSGGVKTQGLDGKIETYIFPEEGFYEESPKGKLPLVLFVVTLLTTTIAGAFYEGVNPLSGVLDGDFSEFLPNMSYGLPFSLSLLLILGTHEFGHFFAARRHKVKTTYPFFIPAPPVPPMIGTFGAVIRIKSPILTKKALIDIGAAGPLAGFVVALILTVWGFNLSEIATVNPSGIERLGLGSSVLLEIIEYMTVGYLSDGYEVMLHPIAFAGWIGLFITALNLMPMGQLDGGHIIYAVIGRRHKKVSITVACCLIILGSFTWLGWTVWGILVFIIGLGHPPIEDDQEVLDKHSKIICLLSLIVFLLTLTPTPFYIISL